MEFPSAFLAFALLAIPAFAASLSVNETPPGGGSAVVGTGSGRTSDGRIGLELGAASGSSRLAFGSAAQGFPVVGLRFGTASFVASDGPAQPLWKLVFRKGVGGGQKVLQAGAGGTCSRTPGGLRFVWTNLDLESGDRAVDVACDVIANADDERYEFRIAVTNRSSDYGLFSTEYPRVASVVRPGTDSAILPVGNWGTQRHRSICAPMKAFYPSYRCPFQFAAFEKDSGEGLMIHALDAEACQKYVCVDEHFGCAFETPAENAGQAGAAGAPRFAVALAPYRGSWWPAAKKYRAWAKSAFWLKKDPIAGRADYPAQMRNGGFWFRTGANDDPVEKSEGYVNRLLGRIQGRVPVSVHWYCWHKHRFDTLYPDFFPARAGFGEAVKRLTAKGVTIMPYVNGRIWDQLEPSFPSVRHLACLQDNGIPYEEVWNKRTFSAMCPVEAFWQDKMVAIGDRLVSEYGANAFYYDQIASMTPVTCYAANHHHAPGGGHHWVDGYRQLLTRIRAKHPGLTMTSENFSEPYVDLIDGFLTWSPNLPEDLPGIPAIYSGYLNTMACNAAPEYTIEAFRATQGRSFLWGCQCGWLDSWILQDRQRDKFDYLLKLAELRQTALDYFSDGELIGDVPNRANETKLSFVWKRWKQDVPVTMPAVQATRWRNPAGNELVAVANYASTPQAFDGGEGVGAHTLAAGEVKLIYQN